nr:DNA-primase RepB domain-containing protein [uncultured Sphingomonas sp.]
MIPRDLKPLTTGRVGRAAREASIRFVVDLWPFAPDVFTFLGTKCGDRWCDHPIAGDRESAVAAVLADHPVAHHDLYFCPNPFSAPRRLTSNALPNAYAWCDIDTADPDGYDPAPNILWETSPGRYQGIWLWRDVVAASLAERHSQAIIIKDGGDRGGWSATKMLRVPGTINHKAEYERPLVTLRVYDHRPQRRPASLTSIALPPGNAARPIISPEPSGDARAIMRRYRRDMGLPAGVLMTARRMLGTDRSRAVFQIVVGMIEAGAPDADIAIVLLDNPYFLDKWGSDPAKADEEVARIRARIGGAR